MNYESREIPRGEQIVDMSSTYSGQLTSGTVRPIATDTEYRGEVQEDLTPEPPIESDRDRKHQITIEPLDYGYLVSVGCQKLAVESSERLIKKLGEYLANPGAIQSTWFSSDKSFMSK